MGQPGDLSRTHREVRESRRPLKGLEGEGRTDVHQER